MPKSTMSVVLAAKYLVKEKRFQIITATGLLVASTLFVHSVLFSMNTFVSGEAIEQAFAQEESTISQFPFSLEQDAAPEGNVTQQPSDTAVQQEDVGTEGNATAGPSCPPGTVLTEGNATAGPSCQPATEGEAASTLDVGTVGETDDGGLGEETDLGATSDCYYAGQRYSEGSTVVQAGVNKTCRNGQWVAGT